MKKALRSFLLFFAFTSPVVLTFAQSTKTTPQPKVVNPYLKPETGKPLDQDPLLWDNYPHSIDQSLTLKNAYKEALANKDGYTMVQLAKIEFDHVYTYGNLTPSKMLNEAYLIALQNKDPFLAFYITNFESKFNLFSQFKPKEMVDKTYELALLRKEYRVLVKLSYLQDYYGFSTVSPVEMRKKAIAMNSKALAHFPNPYDSPNPDKSVKQDPLTWADFPVSIENQQQFDELYIKALKIKDGYKLLQLKRYQQTNRSSKRIDDNHKIFQEIAAIAWHNRDPYLSYYLTLLDLKISYSPNDSTFIAKTYEIALERKEAPVLTMLADLIEQNKTESNLTASAIRTKAAEIKK